MDLTLNDERNVTNGNVDQLLEAAIAAAGEEVGERAKEQRRRDNERHRKQLATVEADLDAERHRAESAEQLTKATEAEHQRVQSVVREIDREMLAATAERATGRFRIVRNVVRGTGVLVALVPLISAVVLWLTGNGWIVALVIGVVGALLAACAAMDRPGAWLSSIIQQQIDAWAEGQLRAAGRHDLASRVMLTWSGGVASAQLGEQ